MCSPGIKTDHEAAKAQEACRQAMVTCMEKTKAALPAGYDSSHFNATLNYLIALQAPYQSLIDHAATKEELPGGSINEDIQLNDGSYVSTKSMLGSIETAQDIKAAGRANIQSDIDYYKSLIKTSTSKVATYTYQQKEDEIKHRVFPYFFCSDYSDRDKK